MRRMSDILEALFWLALGLFWLTLLFIIIFAFSFIVYSIIRC